MTDVAEPAVVEALLAVSRVMVALAARSLARADPSVTLPQYRALVVLAAHGPQRPVDVAVELGVNPSTGTRMGDRLVRKGLVRRMRPPGDRRNVALSLTATGRALVAEVTRLRREQLNDIASAIPDGSSGALTEALTAFAVAAEERRDDQWWLGWQEHDATATRSGDG